MQAVLGLEENIVKRLKISNLNLQYENDIIQNLHTQTAIENELIEQNRANENQPQENQPSSTNIQTKIHNELFSFIDIFME